MWHKVILALALAVVFVVSTLTALFGAGRIVNATLETFVFKVENCRYDYEPRLVVDKTEEELQEFCAVDYNSAKRDIARGTGMFIVFAPIAWFMFGQTKKSLNDPDLKKARKSKKK